MKRAVLWIAGAGVASVALMLALRAQEQRAQTPAPQASAPPTSATATAETSQAEKIIYTFPDDAQMQQFAQLWQQRQGMITRMAVLQAYWNQEQADLVELNKTLLSQYSLDVNKNYTLDAQRKVLVERETPPEQPAVQVSQAQAQPQPTTTSTP